MRDAPNYSSSINDPDLYLTTSQLIEFAPLIEGDEPLIANLMRDKMARSPDAETHVFPNFLGSHVGVVLKSAGIDIPKIEL